MKCKPLVILTLAALPVISFADDMSSTSNNVDTNTFQSNTGTKEPLSDTAITSKVNTAFLKEKLFGNAEVSAFSISVETMSGIVYLTGTAKNKMQIDNAIKVAQSVEGVKKVVSEVTVSN